MPYIKKEQRPRKDPVVVSMFENGMGANDDIEELLRRYCERHISTSYNKVKNFIAELNECSAEITRRAKFLKDAKKTPVMSFLMGDENWDEVVDSMKECDVKADGDLNYILFKYCKEHIEAHCIECFADELVNAGKRIRRRILAPYENGKIEENGDV